MDAKSIQQILNEQRQQSEIFKKTEEGLNKTIANKQRWSDPEFIERRQVALKSALDRPEVQANRIKAQKELRTDEFNQKHKKIMQQLYQTDKWKESVKNANANPIRNEKIRQAHAKGVITPDGFFLTLGDAGKFYNLTSEGIRHRIKTQPDRWFYADEGPKLSNRYRVETSYGKFLSISECYRYSRENNLFEADKLLDGAKWFSKMLKKYPKDFKKL